MRTPTSVYVPDVAEADVPAYILIASNPVNVESEYVPAQETSIPARIHLEVNPFGVVGSCITSPREVTVTVLASLKNDEPPFTVIVFNCTI